MNRSPRSVHSFSFSATVAERVRQTNEALRKELSLAEEKMQKLEAENRYVNRTFCSIPCLTLSLKSPY